MHSRKIFVGLLRCQKAEKPGVAFYGSIWQRIQSKKWNDRTIDLELLNARRPRRRLCSTRRSQAGFILRCPSRRLRACHKTCSGRRRQYRGLHRYSLRLAKAFIVEKEKGLSSEDWASDRRPELIAAKRRLSFSNWIEVA